MQKSELRIAILTVTGTLLLAACSNMQFLQPPNDQAITAEIQAKLFEDSVLKTRDIHVTSEKGVVTLTGDVATELEKAAAERIAGRVSGVKSVTNQLTVAPPPAPEAATLPPETPAPIASTAAPPARAQAPAPTGPARHRQRTPTLSLQERITAGAASGENPPSAAPAPPPTTAAATPAAPAASPVRQPEHITVAAGTVVTVRTIDSIDSTRNHSGEEFAATVEAPVVVGDRVVIPQGADARVRLVEARSAGHMTGSSELRLELVGLTVGGNTYPVESSVVQKQGASRGTRTAETVGGGSVLGALIGAIAGRGKGAAIGAAAGAGAGTATEAATHGEQVKVPSETKLDFTLKVPLTVTR
jgi:hypothetical protein